MHHKRLVDPVFLMCSERSGSNLIARIFGAHPEFFAPSPAHLFRVFAGYDPDQDLGEDLLLLFDAKLGIWRLDAWTPEARRALFDGCATTQERIAALLNAEGKLHSKSRVFLKENSVHGYVETMERVAETPQYVLMVRDPRDMAASWIKAPTLRGGVVRATRRWLSDLKGSLATETPARPLVKLTYEALISTPEETLRRVCGALGITFAQDMLTHMANNTGVAQDAGRTALWQNLSRGIMSDNFNKFQDQLTDDQIAYVEATCAPLMAQFGYGLSRPDDAAPFGSHPSLAALEAALEAEEPWTKPAYQALPDSERARLERWSALREELDQRHAR